MARGRIQAASESGKKEVSAPGPSVIRCVIVCERDEVTGTSAFTVQRTDRFPPEPLAINGRSVVVEVDNRFVDTLLARGRFAERLAALEQRVAAMDSPMPRESLFPQRQATPLGD